MKIATSSRAIGAVIKRRIFQAALGLCVGYACISGAFAAAISSNDVPLATRQNGQVKPNLMFIVDDSGSMSQRYMPDDLKVDKTFDVLSTYGYYSSQCNGTAYDPSLIYTPPVDQGGNLKSDGTASLKPNSSFPVAWDDGFVTGFTSPKTDLTGAFYYVYTGAQPKMGWTYTQSGVIKTTAFYSECMTPKSLGSPVFTKVLVTAASPVAEQINYANWWSYYSQRASLMRTAIGRAMVTVDDNFRVGMTTIHDPYGKDVGGNLFLDIADFVPVQKKSFFDNLYLALRNDKTSSLTPLRTALAKVGRYYANKAPYQISDPVQYSCQRNFAVLATDGYWDTGFEGKKWNPTLANAVPPTWSFQTEPLNQPFKLNNTTLVGDEDSSEVRPMKDVNHAATTLADVAQYYYATDLRTSSLGNCTGAKVGAPPVANPDVCSNNVRFTPGDPASHQHMSTFTVGMGINGTVPYDKNYLTQTSGAYTDIVNGTRDWPVPTASLGYGSGPASDATDVDDLWHAAVNGRGQYYMALDSGAMVDAIAGIVASLKEIDGAASAASTSSLELVAGTNNFVYGASYTTDTWTGDLQAYAINAVDATISTFPTWSAQAKLDARSHLSRKILFNKSGVLTDFQWGNLSTTQQAYFTDFCNQVKTGPVTPSQCPSLDSNNLPVAKNGDNMVNYLRGMRTYESIVPTISAGATATTTMAIYRKRSHVLGDIVNGAPAYQGKPPYQYGDAGYQGFATAKSSRNKTIYAASNDGMLHAFSAEAADGGTELWAYVPSMVMPDLHLLANASYAGNHQYSVDGAPVLADINAGGGVWKTILVGGLNRGGRGYYALDVTDPLNPKALWEFTDVNLGLSFGNPIVTKRMDGTWVVVFSSGYNNTTAGADGDGHLFVLNANTGAKILDIPTKVGTIGNPSGLGKINSWVDDSGDNTSKRFYGGDLLGNLWRFDIDGLTLPHSAALLLATFKAAKPQEITTQPLLTSVAGQPVVVVGTGIYLSTPDVTDTSQHAIYAVKDPLNATGWGDVRNNSGFVKQVISITPGTATTASISKLPVDWTANSGWWVDLPHTGERVITPPKLQYDTLAIATAIPDGGICTLGGASWLYFMNIANGADVTASGLVGQMNSASAIIVGLTWVKDTSGQIGLIGQDTNGQAKYNSTEISKKNAMGSARRTSWRELAD
jgi:type IV pilus assembly protein PilY1